MSDPKDFLDKDGKWTCTACGACCRSIWMLVDKGFPKPWVNKKGGCKNQTTKGKCRVYETRPDICRVENTLKTKYSDLEIAEMCAQMKNHQEGLSV